jgi:hypothetical protein
MTHSGIQDNYKIWMFQTNRPVYQEEQTKLSPELNAFIEEWAAHGTSIVGAFEWINPFILVIGVDETVAAPGGCSLDAETRFLKQLGAQHSIDFFVRMKVVALDNNEWKQLSFEEVVHAAPGKIQIVDTTINNWADFKQKGIVAPNVSGLSTLF